MIVLPIVERELRDRARRPVTYRIRTGAALLGILAGAVILMMSRYSAPGRMGGTLFSLLAWPAFFFCLLEGVRQSSDTLSSEKREGTLGFLFLTDLSGHDVVLGKVAAISVNSFYALLGVLPVLSMSMLLGGVTGTQFWQVSLALVNALFFAVACGMRVSVWSWREGRAWVESMFLMGALTAGLPLLGWVAAAAQRGVSSEGGWFGTVFTVILEPMVFMGGASPAVGFFRGMSGTAAALEFWRAFAACQLLSWALLRVTGWRLPRVWQENPDQGRPMVTPATARPVVADEESAVTTRRANSVRKEHGGVLRSENPVAWLAGRGGDGPAGLAWLAVVLGVMFWIYGVQAGAGPAAAMVMWPFKFFLQCVVAYQACHFFREARRTGALELLAATPLTAREVVRGQMVALVRMFKWPVLTMMTAHLVFALVTVLEFGDVRSHGGRGLNILGVAAMPWVGMVYAQLSLFLGILAVAYLGMYLALGLRKPGAAVSLTVLWALVLPQFAVCCFPFLDVGIQFGIVILAKETLEGRFRLIASPDSGDVHIAPTR